MIENRYTFKHAFIKTIPIMAGYVFLGFAFGLLMRTSGFPIWYPVLMSLFIYSGALQFATIPLVGVAVNPLSALMLGVMISARHLFYGIAMLKRYRHSGSLKYPLIFGLTDETFSVLSTENQEDEIPSMYYFTVTSLDYLYWNAGTLFGAIAGGVIPFDLAGLDFALTAMFIVLLLEQMKIKQGMISGLTGLVVSGLSLLLFGSGQMVITSMVGIVVALLVERQLKLYE
ncbi:MAG: AzlC family ABC transporter permease [Bulleidia sp.]|nr:AzlC family ABC transporter permease [Bulleidia sp.]